MKFDFQGAVARSAVRGRTIIGGVAGRGWLTTLAGTALAALAMLLAPAWAQAALPVCVTNISTCCKITNSGSYSVSSHFPASGYAACIRINASNVSLNGNGHAITGPGGSSTMKGLVIATGANNAVVTNLTMSGFDTGVEVNAKRATLNSVYGSYSSTNGMVINGRAFVGDNFGGSHNGVNGVVFNPTAVGAYALMVSGDSNGKAGIKIKGLIGGWFQGALVISNGTYGIWLRGTTGVSLSDFIAISNTIAGVYLGCHGDGPSNASCSPGTPRTNANTVTSTNSSSPASMSDGGSGPVQKYGVAIDDGNHFNHVTYIEGDSNSIDDGYDGNPSCDSNRWSNNHFTYSNQSCVPALVTGP